MVLLFISLHADTLGRKVLPESLFLDNHLVPWYIIVLKDCGVFCHMSACSLIHFALCDVSLIYAFESMELGTKAGPKVKEFYRTNVHRSVAVVSGGIVAFSICRALVLAWFRMLRELLETAIALVSVGVEAAGDASNVLFSSLLKSVDPLRCALLAMASTPAFKWISTAYSRLVRLATALMIWILAMFVPYDRNEKPLMERLINISESTTQDDSEGSTKSPEVRRLQPFDSLGPHSGFDDCSLISTSRAPHRWRASGEGATLR